MELLKRIDTSLLYPEFLRRLIVLLLRCQSRGAEYHATSGLRSFEEQARRRKLYVTRDPVTGKRLGTKAAPAGLSEHNYGLAVDFAPDGDLDKPGLQANYGAEHYRILGEEIAAMGTLAWGASFGDMPHVGFPNYVSGKQLKALLTVWNQATGDEARRRQVVWAYLDCVRERVA